MSGVTLEESHHFPKGRANRPRAAGLRGRDVAQSCNACSPGGSPWLRWPDVHWVTLVARIDRPQPTGLQGVNSQALPPAWLEIHPWKSCPEGGPCLWTLTHWSASKCRRESPHAHPLPYLGFEQIFSSRAGLPRIDCAPSLFRTPPASPPLPWEQAMETPRGAGWGGVGRGKSLSASLPKPMIHKGAAALASGPWATVTCPAQGPSNLEPRMSPSTIRV